MIFRAAWGVAIVIALATCGSQAPQSRAQRIGKLEEVIGGPHAVGEVGDFILENDQIRLIIADKSFRLKDGTEVAAGRVNTTFGGTLIDADLQRPAGDTHGNDQLAELLPGFVFTVIDPTDVSVTADGSDGGPAEVTVTGIGGDLFEMVSLLNTGLVFPSTNPPLQMTQVYRLEPGKKYVTIETTIKNPDSGAHPFPYLMPSQLDSLLGMNIPGISSLQLSAPLGQFPLLGGEQSLFVPGIAGFNVRFAIQDSYKQAKGFPAFPGMVADFLASRGPGVSYGLTIPSTPDNYVNTFNTGYGNQKITPYSMLLPFTYAGVTGAYMYNPPAQLQAGEQRTYESYFVIGKGDVASVLDTIYEIRAQPTGTFGGYLVDSQTSAPVGNATVMVFDSNGDPLDQMTTDAGGAFFGHLAPGNYSYRVLADDRVTTDSQSFTITAGQATGVFVTITPPASLAVSVVDELGRHAPVKIQLIGHNSQIKGIDGRDILYSLTLGERVRPTAYDGSDRYVENAWWTVDGQLSATVRPGTYDLVVSRGPEYELYTKTISIEAGSYAAELVQLQRSFTTDGWIAGDFHIHAQPSTDSGLPIPQRVASCAAEGLDVATATDHNFITDYAPVIGATGLANWLLGIPGMELTTFEMGHFIGFPLTVDPGSTRGGEFQWFHQTPGDLFATLRGLATDPASAIVDVAHPRQPVLGYFSQFFIDQDTAQPYAPSGILGVFAPYGMEFQAPAFTTDFDALELVTGRRLEDIHTFKAPNPLPAGPFPDPQPVPGQVVLGADGHPTFPGVAETWFTMLDHGLSPTGMGASDSHQLLGNEPGYARTMVYVGAGKDTPGGFTRDDVISAIKAHHAIATTAPLVEMTIKGAMIGATVVDTDPTIDVDLIVKAPSWATVNELTVYSNGGAVVYDQPIPAGQGTYEAHVPVQCAVDCWIVAEVNGDSNMFPVNSATEFPPLDVSAIIGALSVGINLSSLPITSALIPQHLHYAKPFAITNPIWVDIDGNGWHAPKPPLAQAKSPATRRPPDVREQFKALPEISR